MNKKVALSLVVVVLTATMLACQFSGLVPTGIPMPTPTVSAALPSSAQSADVTNQSG